MKILYDFCNLEDGFGTDEWQGQIHVHGPPGSCLEFRLELFTLLARASLNGLDVSMDKDVVWDETEDA